jgi:hypothetical protein
MRTRVTVVILAVVVLAGVWMGCKEDPPASLYDPNYVSGPQPKVTSIAPATDALAGVTMLTITGQNFSDVPANNLVFFDKTYATALTSSATQITVKAPLLAKDSIQVKIAVSKSDLYSDPFLYNLDTAAFEKWATYGTGEYGAGIECDRNGNLYVSLLSTTGGLGVKKFTPTGVRTDYAPILSTSVASWRNMKFGPGDTLFCVATGRAIVFAIPSGANPAVWKSGGGLGNLNDLDFDANGNIWAAGATGNIYKVSRTKVVTSFPCVGTLRGIRVFNNAVYVAGRRDSLEKVWRFPIVGADSLGAESEYFNITAVYGSGLNVINAIAFMSDGSLLIGTDNAEGLRLVAPGGASSAAYYPGVVFGQTVSLTWGTGANLYQSRQAAGAVTASAVRINTQKSGAPYYGRSL